MCHNFLGSFLFCHFTISFSWNHTPHIFHKSKQIFFFRNRKCREFSKVVYTYLNTCFCNRSAWNHMLALFPLSNSCSCPPWEVADDGSLNHAWGPPRLGFHLRVYHVHNQQFSPLGSAEVVSNPSVCFILFYFKHINHIKQFKVFSFYKK